MSDESEQTIAIEVLAGNEWCPEHDCWYASEEKQCPKCRLIALTFDGLFSRDVM